MDYTKLANELEDVAHAATARTRDDISEVTSLMLDAAEAIRLLEGRVERFEEELYALAESATYPPTYPAAR